MISQTAKVPRILFVVNADEFGGLEVVLLDWLLGVDYSKASVVLCYRSDVLRDRLAARNLPVETLKVNIANGERWWTAFWKWRRVFSSLRPSKIILMEGNVGDLALAPVLAARFSTESVLLFSGGGGGTIEAAKVSGAPRKLHFGFLPGLRLYRFKESFKQKVRSVLLQRRFLPSQGLKDNVVACFGFPASQLSVLYHGVDTERFQPSPTERDDFRRANGIPSDAIVIASHGRIAPIKRVDRILEAFAILSAENPNIWLLLTCYGPLKDEIERTVASSDAYRRVRLLGFQADASKLLKAADIYVLASDREGFGIALIEAMAAGLVCVATNCQGPAEIIVNGENGILVEPVGEAVLAGLRHALRLSAEERTQFIAQARKSVESRFEIRSAVRRALDSMGIPSS
jgi:glycosyltransferase involved in cell wall biosynthesis